MGCFFSLYFHIPKKPVQEFRAHIFRDSFVGNLVTVKRSLKIGVNSSDSKKVFLCTDIKANVNLNLRPKSKAD